MHYQGLQQYKTFFTVQFCENNLLVKGKNKVVYKHIKITRMYYLY